MDGYVVWTPAWTVYGLPWYFPTVRRSSPNGWDCQAEAILTASIFKAKDLPYTLRYSFDHVWVDYPGKGSPLWKTRRRRLCLTKGRVARRPARQDSHLDHPQAAHRLPLDTHAVAAEIADRIRASGDNRVRRTTFFHEAQSAGDFAGVAEAAGLGAKPVGWGRGTGSSL